MHFSDILQLAALAWREIKSEGDPEFNACALTHRENLGAAAKAAVDSGQAFNRFDQVVLRLHRERQEAQAEAERILEANPKLHADEVTHIASGAPHPLAAARFAGHVENVQMAAVREEFKGVDSSGFAAKPEIAHLVPLGGTPVIPAVDTNQVTEGLKGAITVSETDGKTSATVNVESPKGPLPKDFPAHDLLHAAGINTYTQLSKVEDLTTIAGIGKATAEKITVRLAQDSQPKES